MLPQSLSKEAPWITTAGDTFYLYQTNSCDPSAISGLTSKASVTVKGTGGATSTPPPTATPTASLVTATLTANGGSDITINAGEYVTLNWSSTNAASVSGVVTSDSPDTCTTKLSFTGTKGSGSYKLGPIGACRAGHTYTITYTAVDASGNRASASAIVHVRATSASAPLSSFTAAVLVGMQSTLTQISEMLRGLGGN
ncbi:MAG: hypothetical protein A2854_00695 [Parcubacteria group bacterium RIFCSPHIGHO2_01_FULL_56_18]|nr:MAG: hypothetical protein A2854_00695 [Parcubacteria group bacterium RIFCSPHIGHO2_01_FULL_56_18]